MGDQLMSTNVGASLVVQYNYPNKFYPKYVGRAARALSPKTRAARSTADVLWPGANVREQSFSAQLYVKRHLPKVDALGEIALQSGEIQ